MQAIAGPDTLRFCPVCGDRTTGKNGALRCACGWDERDDRGENRLLVGTEAPARALAWIDTGHNGTDPALVFEQLPPIDALPDSPIVLDATASREKIAAFYGVHPPGVTMTGTDPLEANMHVRQWLDGAYHASTIARDGALVQKRIENAIEIMCETYDRPLFGIMRKLMPLFEWPENAVVLHYGGARGLNLGACDAVVCLGAPHPNVSDLRRTARLLTASTQTIAAGGDEYSTRKPGNDEPPIGGHLRRSYVPPDHGPLEYRGDAKTGRIPDGMGVSQKVK
jgi:hypothetical protein